ncbi:Na+/proline symporter [Thermoplasmatales archaeon BRNA1]|nr:Na+/proline symporter [Thermoplasmatales archaeon BRNA1]
MWMARAVVVIIAIVAAAIALDPESSIMDLVSFAWAGFGAAFGPVVLLSLYWRRSNGWGALAGMITGFITVIIWNTFLSADSVFGLCAYDTGLYELVPGFLFALIAIIAVSLMTPEPEKEIQDEFDEVAAESKGLF